MLYSIIYSTQFLPPAIQLPQALPSSIVQICPWCFGGAECPSAPFLPYICVTPGSKILNLSSCMQPAGHPAMTVWVWLRLSCTSFPPSLPSSRSSPCSFPPCPPCFPPPIAFLRMLNEIFGLKSLSELWKAFYYLPEVTCLCNSCKLFWLFLLAVFFSPILQLLGKMAFIWLQFWQKINELWAFSDSLWLPEDFEIANYFS